MKNVNAIVLVLLILVLIGALPVWNYSAGWGPYPAGSLGFVALVLLVLLLLGKL